MIILFGKTIYIDDSLIIFNRIREYLDLHKIPYNYKLISHQDALISPGSGTSRSFGGNIPQKLLYEIKVSKKDFEKVNSFVKSLK